MNEGIRNGRNGHTNEEWVYGMRGMGILNREWMGISMGTHTECLGTIWH
jgi:hypothetical protein